MVVSDRSSWGRSVLRLIRLLAYVLIQAPLVVVQLLRMIGKISCNGKSGVFLVESCITRDRVLNQVNLSVVAAIATGVGPVSRKHWRLRHLNYLNISIN